MLTTPSTRRLNDVSPDAFAHVDTWVFDLDNTLYSPHSNIFGQVDIRIKEFVAKILNVDLEEAYRIQKSLYRQYGTSLRGLMTEYGIEADAFLEYVHDIDHSVLEPDPELGEAIRRLPGRRFIMTNGTRTHATKTADRLGITQHFDDIFDIVAADLIPKPDQSAYATFFALHGIVPERAAMFEDLSRNLIVPHSVGMRTVLVLPPGELPLFRQTWELEGAGDAHVDFATDDLTDFLTKALATVA